MSGTIWYVDELNPRGNSAFRGMFRDLSTIESYAAERGFVRGRNFGPKEVEFNHPETRNVLQVCLYGTEVWIDDSVFE